MKNEDIKKLVIGLPDDSPYLIEVRRRFFRRQKVLSPDDRLVYPMRDPAFRFHFASSYARVPKILPPEVWCHFTWHAYCQLRYGDQRKDDAVGPEVLALGHPVNRPKQALLKGLLCTDLSYEEVARWTGLSSEVVETYSRWFFDFPARRDDRTFAMDVVNPKTELRMLRSDRRPDPVLLLMRLGYQQGPEAVVREAKLIDQRRDAHSDQTKNLKHILLSDATIKAKMGLLESDDPGFMTFKAVAAAQAIREPDAMDDDWRMGFGALSLSASAQLVIKQITNRSALEKLKAGQAIDAQVAAQAAKQKEIMDIGSA